MRKPKAPRTFYSIRRIQSQAAVLVAIAIPVFTSQLEKSREATDAANIRSQYGEIVVKILEAPDTAIDSGYSVTLQQGQDGWQGNAGTSLGELAEDGDVDTGDLAVVVNVSDSIDHTKAVNLTYTPGTASAAPTLTIGQGE